MARHADPHARTSLLEAGAQELARVGIARARIEDITRLAGLSKGAFYLHFADKEALFQELLDAMMARLAAHVVEREAAVTEFLSKNPITARDVRERSARHEALLALESQHDEHVLRLMWQERRIFTVLLRGASGTRFEGVAWDLADAEVGRLEEAYTRMQGLGACRDDMPPEVFGSLVVGTYFLLAARMTRLKSPPDFPRWVNAIQRLIREGSAPKAPAARSSRPRARRRHVSTARVHSGGVR